MPQAFRPAFLALLLFSIGDLYSEILRAPEDSGCLKFFANYLSSGALDISKEEERLIFSERFSAVSNLISGVGHIFRNAGMAIGAFSRRALEKIDGENNIRFHLEIVKDNVVFLEELTKDMEFLFRKRAADLENSDLFYHLLPAKSGFSGIEPSPLQSLHPGRLLNMIPLLEKIAGDVMEPVSTILSSGNMILRMVGKEHRLRKYVDVILIEAGRLERVLSRIQGLGELESASLKEGEILPVLQELHEATRKEVLYVENGIFFKMTIEDKLPQIMLDSYQLKLALKALIDNAIAAMPHGGSLAMNVARNGNHLMIIVTDTGGGIHSGEIPKIFDPFVTTGDTALGGREPGAGLGLLKVYRIIENHNGQLDLQSEVGRGTTVTIKLPFLAES